MTFLITVLTSLFYPHAGEMRASPGAARLAARVHMTQHRAHARHGQR